MSKKLLIILIGVIFSLISINVNAKPQPWLLNKVSYQLTAEKWATTNTAKVIVNINAALSDNQLSEIHQNILSNLKKIAPHVDWHITRFDRRKDNTGLEQLYAQAQARLPNSALASLRNKAKDISKPGQTYRIAAIDFTPSLQEKQSVKDQLRDEIYTKINAEIQRLNKVYSKQKFFVNSINFSAVTPMPRTTMMIMAKPARVAAEPEQTGLAISNEIRMTANVILASRMKLKHKHPQPPKP